MKLHALAALLLAAFSAGASADDRRTYIVILNGEPAASYAGGVAGLSATQPAPGRRFNINSPEAQAYVRYLTARQQNVATLVGNAPVIATYNTVLNGFAARLTEAEVLTLKASGQVLDIQLDTPRQPTTISTSAFLGLTAPGGLWSQTVGAALNKGEDVIIGIVDSGIWPENPAFADRELNGVPTHSADGTQVYGAPTGWSGACVDGTGFTASTHCNNKLIGAQYFNAGFNASGQTPHWTEFLNSPRDSVAGPTGHGGHGTHTASTAGGNGNNPVVINGLALGKASGMAPRARIAAYKVCWTYVNPDADDGTGTQNSCYNSDSVKAIEKAVQDGVHVINYSISGSQTSVNDPVEQAFLKAARAGVFVAASAGNSGPSQAVAHVSPWLTTVAASTHDRLFKADLTLGNGAQYWGASMNPSPLPSAPMILSTAAKAATASNADAEFCKPTSGAGNAPTLDPAKAAGKIVVCTRGGGIARVDKSQTVANAGGAGMVLADNGAGLVAESHAVPTVHVDLATGVLVKTYAAGAGATGAIGAFYLSTAPAPIMAAFSSRGPNAGDSNLLKPDLTAPGVDVIAAVTANLSEDERDAVANGTAVPPANFASYQGTSMSSPHVAGLAALLRQAHPAWSPAAIKSALMTSAGTTLDDGQPGAANGLLPWSQGAGHVTPNQATDPGLVYDAGASDWTRYQCKVNRAAVVPASDCTTVGTLDETYNLNLPSITVGNALGTTTVTRRVTNVGATAATYESSIAVPGATALVTPSSLTLDPGETKAFTVKLTNDRNPINQWAFGSLSWTDHTHVVNIPVSLRAGKSIVAPEMLTGDTTSGTRLITVRTGFSGRMTANKGGLKDVTLLPQASLVPGQLDEDGLKEACIAGADLPNVKVHSVTIPAGTVAARFALRQQDVSAAGDDNDLLLLAPDGSHVYSGNGGSVEAAQLASPAAGDYRVCVVAYGGGATMWHKLSSWIVTRADVGGKLNVMLPSQVYSGGSATVGITWSGLAPNGRYVGGVQYKDPDGTVQATTVLRVDTNGGLPAADPTRDISASQMSKKGK
ncbi:S8 family serine peptidase [Pseudoduganella sp. LjRoot289]|uniref:S8 family serine peptidase n=1 Tax=Pseudoduganella sp. LjRoot289 TaxID=3342314 RepID=UPI003ECD835F